MFLAFFDVRTGLGVTTGHFAEIVDLPRENERIIKLLLGVGFELRGDVHVLGAAEHLGIDHISYDRLIFAGKIFVQQLREAVAGNFVFVGFGFSHVIPPFELKGRLHIRPLRTRRYSVYWSANSAGSPPVCRNNTLSSLLKKPLRIRSIMPAAA